jgi:hypothetical protein
MAWWRRLIGWIWCGHYTTAWECDDAGHPQLRCVDCWKVVWQ